MNKIIKQTTTLFGLMGLVLTLAFTVQKPVFGSSRYQPQEEGIRRIAWHPSSSILAVAIDLDLTITSDNDEQLWLFNSNGEPVSQLVLDETHRIGEIAWNSDGSKLAVSTKIIRTRDNFIYVWDTTNLESPSLLATLHQDIPTSADIAWDDSGTQLASAWFSDVRIWDILTQNYITLEGHESPEVIESVAWNNDGTRLISRGNVQTVIVWDTTTTPITQLDVISSAQPTSYAKVVWSPNGEQFAMNNANDIVIWQWDGATTSYQQIATLSGHTDTVIQVDWKASRLASTSLDHTVRIWDANTWQLVDTLLASENHQTFYALSLSPDGTQVAYANDENEISFMPTGLGVTCDADIPAADTATLIATITSANGSGNPTTICLAPDSTYTFTAINNNLNALPRITGDITIEGQNATITRSGATNFRFFEVEPGANLTLNDLTLSNGNVGDERGGALLNDGDLTLNSVTFNGNSATSGGAIDSESGSATIIDSTFTNNTGVYGGAIDNDDTAIMTISGSTFTSNHALADGGAIHNDGGTLTVSDTTFTTNVADDYAGAIDNDDGDLTLNASTFTSNSSDGGGAIRNDGTLTINAGSVFTTNSAANLGWGGAIYNKSDSTLVINASSFNGNIANLEGGAIRNSGTLTVNIGSTFDGNTAAQYGGAIYNTSATASLTGVQITNNTATSYDAGGVYGNSSTSITITDSTLSGNDSGRRGGGIWSSGTTTLTNVYLTNNTAVVEGGGIYGSSSATISAGNSCISGNSSRAVYSASSTTQNFENNWWGATNGPSGSGPGSGDAVNSKIDYDPFITTACPLP